MKTQSPGRDRPTNLSTRTSHPIPHICMKLIIFIRQGLVNIHSSLSASLTSRCIIISYQCQDIMYIYFMIYDLLSEVNASIIIIIDYNWKLISHVLDNVSYYLTSHHRRLCLILCDYPFSIFVIYIFWKDAWIWYAVIASSHLWVCVFLESINNVYFLFDF